MSLFFDVLSSINNPNQNGSVEKLASVTRSFQQLSSQNNVSSSTLESMMSALGPALSSALQSQGGANRVQDMIAQAASGNTNAASWQSLLTPQLQQQLTQTVVQKLGINSSVVQAMLPALLPIAMNLLNMGASRSGLPGANPLLNAFIGGSANSKDLGHVMKFANRFLQPA